ncbi:LPXTG cell wall anchor domain-containing protein [Enterococcus termitis]|uniref:Gram-positive cocci surface proteins LPxTG domain-containing protein n=1 Tax=Enterococcus termitis TaxID=332950 RepID=A0A1E5H169_9ENTE|nr:LPXTG cell wall anchor domain-containing protein [Enterococcus termitis]OEG18646.1 hypothetical protein BCR25_15700 [Enterococcus termitis]
MKKNTAIFVIICCVLAFFSVFRSNPNYADQLQQISIIEHWDDPTVQEAYYNWQKYVQINSQSQPEDYPGGEYNAQGSVSNNWLNIGPITDETNLYALYAAIIAASNPQATGSGISWDGSAWETILLAPDWSVDLVPDHTNEGGATVTFYIINSNHQGEKGMPVEITVIGGIPTPTDDTGNTTTDTTDTSTSTTASTTTDTTDTSTSTTASTTTDTTDTSTSTTASTTTDTTDTSTSTTASTTTDTTDTSTSTTASTTTDTTDTIYLTDMSNSSSSRSNGKNEDLPKAGSSENHLIFLVGILLLTLLLLKRELNR